jgi:transposase
MEYSSKIMDHHGIVAGVCNEIGLVDIIDNIIIPNEQQKVTTGESLMAMVINSLGFVSKPLYLFPDFMKNKPVHLFFSRDLQPEDFNDDTLGRALDRIYENDPTSIFMQVAMKVAKMENIKRNCFHLDTTTISVHGNYFHDDPDTVAIEITHGYPKDKRFDLKQFVISLITVSESDLPMWVDALSGNVSDKEHFRKVIRNYARMLSETDEKAYFIMDSAMYNEKSIHEMSPIVYWISRVPETITETKELLSQIGSDQMVKSSLEGYSYHLTESEYAGIGQKWLVVFSEKAFEREIKTFERNIVKEETKIENQLWHLGNEEFSCGTDAMKALEKMAKKWKYHRVTDYDIKEKKRTGKRGRPKKDSAKFCIKYKLKAGFEKDVDNIELARSCKGKFILATNSFEIGSEDILVEYKNQQGVERGFRFLKDPMFFTDAIFLKEPRRIVSLVMIMALSLLIYSLAQRKLRSVLKELKETVPDQKGKPTDHPTMRWIFQQFQGIHVLEIRDGQHYEEQILNLRERNTKVLKLLGEPYEKMYFLKEGCGM